MQAAVQPQSFSAARAPGVLGSLSAMMGGGGGRLSVLMGVVVHCKGSAGSLRTAARRGWCGPVVLTQGHQPTAPLGLTISLGSCALLIESPCDLNLMETTHRWPPCPGLSGSYHPSAGVGSRAAVWPPSAWGGSASWSSRRRSPTPRTATACYSEAGGGAD